MTKRDKHKVIEKLKKGHQKVKENWIQGSFIGYGGEVCALGALGMRGFHTPTKVHQAATCFLYEALPAVDKCPELEVTPESKASAVADYNDSHNRRNVLAMYRRAIKAAEAEI